MNAEIQNESYGPDERNVLDLYRAESSQPTPLLFFVHGGGFAGGTTDAVQGSIPLARCLEAGISIASIQHRLTDVAPFPAPMHDAARALQYIRHNAAEWNIDPARVAACGVSSGSGIAQWLGFHEDLADLQNDDPISWQSTKVSCVIALRAQSTYERQTPEVQQKIREAMIAKVMPYMQAAKTGGSLGSHVVDKIKPGSEEIIAM